MNSFLAALITALIGIPLIELILAVVGIGSSLVGLYFSYVFVQISDMFLSQYLSFTILQVWGACMLHSLIRGVYFNSADSKEESTSFMKAVGKATGRWITQSLVITLAWGIAALMHHYSK